jgi:serpin B
MFPAALVLFVQFLRASKSSQDSAVGFAFALWRNEIASHLGFIVSPYSLYRALAVCGIEALPKFRKIFLSTLQFPEPDLSIEAFGAAVREVASDLESKGDFVLRDVNAIWLNSAWKIAESRFNISKTQFSVDVASLVFPQPAKDIINDHIEKATEGLIRDFITEQVLGPRTAFLITNALYLHGQWENRFEEDLTSEQPFKLFDGTSVNTPLMTGEFNVLYSENDWAQLVFLPYKDADCEFVVILPRDTTMDGFRRTLFAFDRTWFERGPDIANVKLILPKFKIQSPTQSLMDTAKKLGLREVLETKEFIFPQPPEEKDRLVIAEILQRVVIEVDERGTVAAAATVIETDLECSTEPDDHFDVKADRAFAYVIRNRETGTIMFMGTCLNPTEASPSGSE